MPRTRTRRAPKQAPIDDGFTLWGFLWMIVKIIIFLYILRHILPVLGEQIKLLFE